jgi:uncharacterized protein YjiS (DUF1127 family)
MAYANVSRAGSAGIADRVSGIVKSVKGGLARRRKYAQTYRELDALTERELSDLGIHRSMIARIAREAAYGN